VEALQIADGFADASAEQGKEPAANDYSSRDRGAVAGAVVRAEGRSNTKPDRSADENVSGISMVPPRSLVSSSRIWALGWKWTHRSGATKLRQGRVASVERDLGGLCVLTSRRGDCVDVASIFFSFSLSSLSFYRLRRSARCKRESSQQQREEQSVCCVFHERILVTKRR
jgi:hypothetical protein